MRFQRNRAGECHLYRTAPNASACPQAQGFGADLQGQNCTPAASDSVLDNTRALGLSKTRLCSLQSRLEFPMACRALIIVSRPGYELCFSSCGDETHCRRGTNAPIETCSLTANDALTRSWSPRLFSNTTVLTYLIRPTTTPATAQGITEVYPPCPRRQYSKMTCRPTTANFEDSGTQA